MPSALGTVISVRCWPHQPTSNVAHSTCSASRCPRRQACKSQDNLDQRLALKRRQSSEYAKQAASGLSTDTPVRLQAKTVIVDEVERLRWRLWHGKAKNARLTLDRIRKVMHAFKGERSCRTMGVPSRKLWTALHEINGYLSSQSS